jgi:predicted DNA-binding transcriptional regulator YafY
VRADRLVALLLLLQQRQRVTAPEVARELEVSERTARRDLEALCMAGLPVYSERGRGGGWRLLGGGRTDLSGLTAQEVRALFLVAGPPSTATPELKAALRKLVRALPETFRPGAEATASTVLVDPGGWGKTRRPFRPGHLDALQEATTEGRQVHLGYSDRAGNVTLRTVHPLGLAQKGTTWYLVAGTFEGLRTFRVSRVRSVELTDEPVVRPEGFELAQSWEQVVERVDQLRSPVEVAALADPDVVDALRWLFEGQVVVGHTPVEGRTPITVRGPRVDMIAGQLAGFGSRVEIVAPPEARKWMANLGRELVGTYGADAAPADGKASTPPER